MPRCLQNVHLFKNVLDRDQVMDIILSFINGEDREALARQYGLTVAAVSDMTAGRARAPHPDPDHKRYGAVPYPDRPATRRVVTQSDYYADTQRKDTP